MSELRKICVALALLLMACGAVAANGEDTGLQERLRTYLTGYWDKENIAVMQPDSLEQKMVDYLYLTQHADSALRRQCWEDLAAKFNESYPDRMVADYLGSRKSPIYSPAMLEEYLEVLMAVVPADNVQHQRVAYMLENLKKNKPGEKIADLNLNLVGGGEETTLHELISSEAVQFGEEIIVMFYDPDCGECDKMIAELTSNGNIGNVIAISISDESKTLPEGWISAMAEDPDDLDDRFYLPEMPVVYKVNNEGIILQ